MSDEPIPETPDRDPAVERAFHYFLDRKGWRPSTLAKKSGVKVAVIHQALLGYAPSLATLRRLCKSLDEVDLWVFIMIGELLNEDDPAASLAAGIDRLKAASDAILSSAEEEPAS